MVSVKLSIFLLHSYMDAYSISALCDGLDSQLYTPLSSMHSDIVLAGAARELNMAPTRMFWNQDTFGKMHISSFADAVHWRSISLRKVTRHPIPECPEFGEIFRRDLVVAFELSGYPSDRRERAEGRKLALNISEMYATREQQRRYFRMQKLVIDRHPCKKMAAPLQCALSFVLGMK